MLYVVFGVVVVEDVGGFGVCFDVGVVCLYV